jgi:hypothetical protein
MHSSWRSHCVHRKPGSASVSQSEGSVSVPASPRRPLHRRRVHRAAPVRRKFVPSSSPLLLVLRALSPCALRCWEGHWALSGTHAERVSQGTQDRKEKGHRDRTNTRRGQRRERHSHSQLRRPFFHAADSAAELYLCSASLLVLRSCLFGLRFQGRQVQKLKANAH